VVEKEREREDKKKRKPRIGQMRAGGYVK